MRCSYVHTNLIARDWRALADFYCKAFGCVPKPPERDLAGAWVDGRTGIDGARIRGIHLYLPGFPLGQGPTLEIFQYDENQAGASKAINLEGFGHIAFQVDDVDACLGQVLALGGSSLADTVRGEVPGVGLLHAVYACDPEGNIIEIQSWA
jgi:lactoylglutathione lyase